jgi:AraC family transcriptional regulator
MNLLEKLNNPLDYIEENLAKNIDFKEVVRLASCSQSYFRRMFSILAGVNLSEYIRRRRLTLAAFELNNSNLRVFDIAVKYGYDSPDSFTRAFQAFHGITPSEARRYGPWLKAYTRMTFQLSMYKENTYEAKDKEDINRKQ